MQNKGAWAAEERVGLSQGYLQVMVRDLYKERDMGHYTGMMTELVEAHGVLALKLTPTKYALPASCMLMHVSR